MKKNLLLLLATLAIGSSNAVYADCVVGLKPCTLKVTIFNRAANTNWFLDTPVSGTRNASGNTFSASILPKTSSVLSFDTYYLTAASTVNIAMKLWNVTDPNNVYTVNLSSTASSLPPLFSSDNEAILDCINTPPTTLPLTSDIAVICNIYDPNPQSSN